MAVPDWTNLQTDINSCRECKRLVSGLLLYCEQLPARPPVPAGGELLFISEAPPPEGGFWAEAPVRDNLREKLFSILQAEGLQLPDPHVAGALEAFRAEGLFLIQTVKWPLCESARNLRPKERELIEHSVSAHIGGELQAIRPRIIIPMGRVACYACGVLFRQGNFVFDRRTRLEDIRGREFTVESEDGRPIRIYPTGLPLKRRAGDLPAIRGEIAAALGKRTAQRREQAV